jgi:hypothetical protein
VNEPVEDLWNELIFAGLFPIRLLQCRLFELNVLHLAGISADSLLNPLPSLSFFESHESRSLTKREVVVFHRHLGPGILHNL